MVHNKYHYINYWMYINVGNIFNKSSQTKESFIYTKTYATLFFDRGSTLPFVFTCHIRFVLSQTFLILTNPSSFITYELYIIKAFFILNLKHKSCVINLYNFIKLLVKVKNIWLSISLIRHVKTNKRNTYQHVAIAS
jgi:hypothetical protein